MAALDRSGLDRLWDLAAERLQRNGLRPQGTVRLQGLGREERHALAGLLGRPVANDAVAVRLEDLDRRLRVSGLAAGLVPVVERLRGPLVDRPAGGRRASRRRHVCGPPVGPRSKSSVSARPVGWSHGSRKCAVPARSAEFRPTGPSRC